MTSALPTNWPNSGASRRQIAAGIDWHVQVAGDASGARPVVLLLHGTGGSTHEWADVLPELSKTALVVAPDLPGHAFSQILPVGQTDASRAAELANPLSLPGMARAVAALLHSLQCTPHVIVGHSAGAAVALRMTLDGLVTPRAIVGLNPALIPPPDFWVDILAPFTSFFVESSWLARGAAWVAQQGGVAHQMLSSSGATLSADQLARYATLFAMPSHCAAALGMMNRWNLPALGRDAVSLAVPFTAYAGDNDKWVPTEALAQQLERIPTATMVRVPGAGHLLPEERPALVIDAVRRVLVSPW
jgi:magnesium chelatase accessory protein